MLDQKYWADRPQPLRQPPRKTRSLLLHRQRDNFPGSRAPFLPAGDPPALASGGNLILASSAIFPPITSQLLLYREALLSLVANWTLHFQTTVSPAVLMGPSYF